MYNADNKNVKPDYYNNACGISCLDNMRLIFGEEKTDYFCIMNAYKYLWRHKEKSGLEDLSKASYYLMQVEPIEYDDNLRTLWLQIDYMVEQRILEIHEDEIDNVLDDMQA